MRPAAEFAPAGELPALDRRVRRRDRQRTRGAHPPAGPAVRRVRAPPLPRSRSTSSRTPRGASPHSRTRPSTSTPAPPTGRRCAQRCGSCGVEASATSAASRSTRPTTTAPRAKSGSAAQVAAALARAGLPGKHFVVNTSDNGRPFTYQQYHPHSDFDNARPCRSHDDRRCVTLGIPPTADVTNAKWHLSPTARRIAARLVDGYLWIGRPWLVRQAAPFDLQRSLAVARSTPF